MIGRVAEKERLLKFAQSDESEFVAVHGRRRGGKTYLIRQTFQDQFAFQHTGIARGRTKEQLRVFGDSLRECGVDCKDGPADWFEAFNLLKKVIDKSAADKKIVFLDETLQCRSDGGTLRRKPQRTRKDEIEIPVF